MSGQHHKDERPRKRRRRAHRLVSLPDGVWWLIRDFAPAGVVWLALCSSELRALIRQPRCWQGFVPPAELDLQREDHCRLVLGLRGAGVQRLGHVAVVARGSDRGELGSLSRAADLLRGLRVHKLSVSSRVNQECQLVPVLSSPASVEELELQRIPRLNQQELAALVTPAALRRLTLSYCQGWTDADCACLEACVSLEYLRLQGCDEVQGLGLRHLQPLGSLRKLELINCGLGMGPGNDGQGIACVRQLRQLAELALEDQPEGTDLTPLRELVQLTHLGLPGCELTAAFLAGLPSAFPALRALDLSGCENIQGPTLRGLLQLRQLQSLKLKVSAADGALMHVLACLPLVALRLGPSPGLTSAELGLLQSCPLLQQLELRSCPGVTSVHELSQLPALRELRLQDCARLVDLGPLQQCTKLELLYLGGVSPVHELPQPPALRELTLSNCAQVTSLDPLQYCAQLQTLYLDRCPLPGTVELPKLAALRELTLQDCARLEDLAALGYCAGLEVLQIVHWTGFLDLRELLPLPSLHELYLHDCARLDNFEALQHFSQLRQVTAAYCTGLRWEQVVALLKQSRGSPRTLHLKEYKHFVPSSLVRIAAEVGSQVELLYNDQLIHEPAPRQPRADV